MTELRRSYQTQTEFSKNTWSTLVTLGSPWAKVDQHWPKVAENCQMLRKFGRDRPNSGPFRPALVEIELNLGARGHFSTIGGRPFGNLWATEELAGVFGGNFREHMSSNSSATFGCLDALGETCHGGHRRPSGSGTISVCLGVSVGCILSKHRAEGVGKWSASRGKFASFRPLLAPLLRPARIRLSPGLGALGVSSVASRSDDCAGSHQKPSKEQHRVPSSRQLPCHRTARRAG